MDAEICGSWTPSSLYGSVEEQKPIMSEIMYHKREAISYPFPGSWKETGKWHRD
jgi:hypothetical protein